ncbi:hypothetical protein [Ancylobacter oerskovii]|uniref:Uncharacterized protein n=1 Tax=Ancylobacter oerskovii TaxID=459519 RepID=A0ABW4Z4Q3_9HYPH
MVRRKWSLASEETAEHPIVPMSIAASFDYRISGRILFNLG